MAFMQINYRSKILFTSTNIDVILPDSHVESNKKHKVLYLLHGAFGDYSNWSRYTSIERYANKYDLAVIMPSAGNSYYQNMANGYKYYDFISEELITYCEATFPISTLKKDKYIAGLSMGGYGAIRVGLSKYNEFNAIASFSGALDVYDFVERLKSSQFADTNFERSIFGDNDLKDVDLRNIITSIDGELPQLYLSCGLEDYLYNVNKEFSEYLSDNNIDHLFVSSPGDHNWDFWDEQIKQTLLWFDLKEV